MDAEGWFLACQSCWSSSTGFANAERQRTPKANALEWHQLKVRFSFPVEPTNMVLGFPETRRALVGSLLCCFAASSPWLERKRLEIFLFCSISVESTQRGEGCAGRSIACVTQAFALMLSRTILRDRRVWGLSCCCDVSAVVGWHWKSLQTCLCYFHVPRCCF